MGRLCYGEVAHKVSAYALDCEILCGCCGDQSSRVWRFGGASVAIGWLSRSGGAPRQNRRELFLLLPSGHSHCVIQTFCLRLTSQLIFGLPADHPVAVSGWFCRRLFPTSTCESAAAQAADHAGLQCCSQPAAGLLLSCSSQFDSLLCAHKLRTAAEGNQSNSLTPSRSIVLSSTEEQNEAQLVPCLFIEPSPTIASHRIASHRSYRIDCAINKCSL